MLYNRYEAVAFSRSGSDSLSASNILSNPHYQIPIREDLVQVFLNDCRFIVVGWLVFQTDPTEEVKGSYVPIVEK